MRVCGASRAETGWGHVVADATCASAPASLPSGLQNTYRAIEKIDSIPASSIEINITYIYMCVYVYRQTNCCRLINRGGC